jgi:hypothetical protein
LGNGLEPYTGRELQSWLTRRGLEFHHQTGDHVHYVDRQGTIVPAGNARADQHVTKVMAERLAEYFGKNAKWLREELGYGSVRRAGGKAIPPPPTARIRGIASIDKIARTAHKMNRDAYALMISERHSAELNTIATMLTRLHDAIRNASNAA